jgi:2-hydroxychromene-2-carboxylate isomerase
VNKQVKVEFLFDFGSPNAYLCHRVIPSIEARTGVKFQYEPILLGGIFKATGNRSPFEAFAQIKNKPDYDAIEITRFLERHDITDFGLNPSFPINTLAIMRGAVAAQKLGIFEKYVDDIYRFMWSDHRKLDDQDELVKALVEAGLPATELGTLMQDSEVKQTLVDNTTRAVERGAFGSPTFFVNDEIYFGKDRLRDVEEAIEKAKNT